MKSRTAMTALAAALMLAACTANVNTTASTARGTAVAADVNAGACARIAPVKHFAQGQLTNTGNALDVAINGRGFLQVLMPDGSAAYTRDGSFKLNADGELVTTDGLLLQPTISIPPDAYNIVIAADGSVSLMLGNQVVPAQVGAILLTDFVNLAGLESRGNLLVETVASGPPRIGTAGHTGLGELQQGFLEVPGVDVADMQYYVSNTQ